MATISKESYTAGLVITHGVDNVRGIVQTVLQLLQTAASKLNLSGLVKLLSSLPLHLLQFLLTICKTVTLVPYGLFNVFRYVLDLRLQKSAVHDSKARGIGSGAHAVVSVLSGMFR
jgi:hypothetical protein